MGFTARLGEAFLAMAFGIAARCSSVRSSWQAGQADALDIERRCALLGASPACGRRGREVRAGVQAVRDRHALVEHEAFALPQALLGWDLSRYFRMPPLR
jgi:hypothetical protein